MKHSLPSFLPIFLIAAALVGCTPRGMEMPVTNNPSPISPIDESAIPLPDADRRPQLLGFGMYVTTNPAQNPIDPPERFTGYHAGLDFEILPGEENEEIPVLALCEGDVIFSNDAEGYGGVVVQECVLNGEDVTVVYGHLSLSSLVAEGEQVTRGRRIGMLAPARSRDSGENRKHLHLAIHKGKELDLLGYVQEETQLLEFIDPSTILRW